MEKRKDDCQCPTKKELLTLEEALEKIAFEFSSDMQTPIRVAIVIKDEDDGEERVFYQVDAQHGRIWRDNGQFHIQT